MKTQESLQILFSIFFTAFIVVLIIAIWNPTIFIIKTAETLGVVAAYLYVIEDGK